MGKKRLHPQKRATKQDERALRKQGDNKPSLVPANSRAGSALRNAWERAVSVTERDIAAFIPTDDVISIGESVLAGAQTLDVFCKMTGLKVPEVKAVLGNPVAMAWISKQIYHLFQHRAAIIDAALYQRAAGGDVQAIKLFYERMGQLDRTQNINVNYSGGVNIQALADDELERIVREKRRLLPAEFRRLSEEATGAKDAEFQTEEGTGDSLPGADGAGSPPEGGAAPVLPEDAAGPPEAADVPRAGEEEEAPAIPGREPDGEDDGG